MWPTFIVTWIAEAGLTMCLEVTCNIGSTQHFATDVAGHFAFMPNHVRAQTIFGCKGRGTGLGQKTSVNNFLHFLPEEPDHVTGILTSIKKTISLLAKLKKKY